MESLFTTFSSFVNEIKIFETGSGTKFISGKRFVEKQTVLFTMSYSELHGGHFVISCDINEQTYVLATGSKNTMEKSIPKIFSDSTTLKTLVSQM